MPWPTMTDYQDAVQNPRAAFKDQELAMGVPVSDALGLPRPVTGAFASVYQVVSGGRKWAVRCFLRYHQDMESRYAAISKHLQSAGLPYTAAFQFLREGIRVLGQWYPLLKMEWVDGEPLNSYIEKNVGNSQALLNLAAEFEKMMRELRSCGIAHGDLQHGNILVVGGKLKLVDYDGMYVPALSGMGSHELGHPNYQHPHRSQRDFGPHLDIFSEWIILASLIALAERPQLWALANGGDEKLLFSKEDLTYPGASKVISAMRSSGSETLKNLVDSITGMLQESDLTRLAPPDGLKTPYKVRTSYLRRIGLLASKALASLRVKKRGNWGGRDQGPRVRVVRDVAAGRTEDLADSLTPGWLQDHLPPRETGIVSPVWVERIIVAAYGTLLGVGLRFAVIKAIPWEACLWVGGPGLVLVAGVLAYRYRVLPEFRKKVYIERSLKACRKEIRRIDGSLRNLRGEKDRVSLEEQKKVQEASVRVSEINAQKDRELDALDSKLMSIIEKQNRSVEDLSRREAAEIQLALGETSGPMLAKRTSAIMQYYKGKREPLLRNQARAREEAARKRQVISERYSRKQEEVLTKLEETRRQLAKDLQFLNERIERESQQLALQRWTATNLSRELETYSQVTFVRFIRKLLFL